MNHATRSTTHYTARLFGASALNVYIDGRADGEYDANVEVAITSEPFATDVGVAYWTETVTTGLPPLE